MYPIPATPSCPPPQSKNTDINRPNFILLQSFLPHPLSPTKAKMSYQIFRNTKSSLESFNLIKDLYAQVVSEDKALCEAVQRNLGLGIFKAGELHPRLERGPLGFQGWVRGVIRGFVQREKEGEAERERERKMGKGGKGKMGDKERISWEDELLCQGLKTGGTGSGGGGGCWEGINGEKGALSW
jgi:hypothetical protein